ncbi:uncharacterized protein LOC62_06G008568 [Vanrija pseudolonga]|uniref:Uncharacterized protein n=1 Tax=Vanrija pseudolonga TaxID=143232 RepID=A0AAF0YGB9_9TREE|nr:hypothetical protein LOC62_06G008568 [Vanrija pseudolonga]
MKSPTTTTRPHNRAWWKRLLPTLTVLGPRPDPQALHHLVNELGFAPQAARRALVSAHNEQERAKNLLVHAKHAKYAPPGRPVPDCQVCIANAQRARELATIVERERQLLQELKDVRRRKRKRGDSAMTLPSANALGVSDKRPAMARVGGGSTIGTAAPPPLIQGAAVMA